MKTQDQRISEAIHVLKLVGMPSEQQNERTAISLLALLNLTVTKEWIKAENPMLGIRGILDFARENYDRKYAENTRESVRKYSVKQMVSAGILLHNPDDKYRPTNSSKNCYQISPDALSLFKYFGTEKWPIALTSYLEEHTKLNEKYAQQRKITKIPLKRKENQPIEISHGPHSDLILAIITQFAATFIHGGELIYVGDTGSKWGYFDQPLLTSLGVEVNVHGKMPDVIIYDREKNWIILIEAVTSSGPVDGTRHDELSHLFGRSKAGIVFVTAFPNRGKVMRQYLASIAWETEVWCASDPTHLIHFNGIRFLGPYPK